MVAIAKMLRGVQRGLDLLVRSDRCVYHRLRQAGTSTQGFGTMFHECFGVPYMKWYSRAEIHRLFSGFSDVTVSAVGTNLGRFSRSQGQSPFGYLWSVEAVKR